MINGFITLCCVLLFLASVGCAIYWTVVWSGANAEITTITSYGYLTSEEPNPGYDPEKAGEALRSMIAFAALAVGFFVLFVMAVML